MTYLERLKAELAHAEANNVTGTIWDSNLETIIRTGREIYTVLIKPDHRRTENVTRALLLEGRTE